LGYREEANDWLVNMKKVRTPKESFVTEMTIADAAETNGATVALNLETIIKK